MPVYSYRREDGTTFDIRQSFSDDPLTVDPETGQSVVRMVQAAGIIFKGSGFYVNDSKSASKTNLSASSNNGHSEHSASSADAKSDTKSESKSESKSDAKTETKSASKTEKNVSHAPAAAD
jgi:putative FmdB family regulatory protein